MVKMKNKKKNSVIVTGNAGFVGRYLTRALLLKGYQVYGFDIQKTKDREVLKNKNFRQKKVDLCSYSSVLRACKSIPDVAVVFHTVAIQPVSGPLDIFLYMNINWGGALNLLKACHENGFKNIVVSSSFSVYGQPEYLPMDELHPTKPLNVYGLSKLQAELLFEYYARKMDFRVVILRYDGIYGVGQNLPGFIQYLKKACPNNEDIELFNEGKQRRDNVFVEDVVDANLRAMKYLRKENFSVFNIGGDEPKSSFETTKTVKEVLQSSSHIILSPKRSILGFDTYMDSRKAKKLLGYEPKTLKHNIKKMIKG